MHDRVHGGAGALWVADAGKNGPALRERIDLTFLVGDGTERFAVVEIGAPIPLTIPRVLLDVLAQATSILNAFLREGFVSAVTSQHREMFKHVKQEEPEPDALAPAVLSDQVHAVVPIAAANQR